jgi:hypothetical protein
MPAHAPPDFCLSVGDREARADCESGELIDCVAAGAPIRKLLFIKALRHTRVPLGSLHDLFKTAR